MRFKALVAATLAATLAVMNTTQATALYVPERYQPVILAVGWAPEDVPSLASVIQCESGWNSLAVGASGEIGLGQIMPSTWRAYEAHGAPEVSEHAWNPAAQLATARVIYEAEGWSSWTCARMLGIQ